jgi:hypothetical protein
MAILTQNSYLGRKRIITLFNRNKRQFVCLQSQEVVIKALYAIWQDSNQYVNVVPRY